MISLFDNSKFMFTLLLLGMPVAWFLFSRLRFKVDMSQFPVISKINDELEKLEAFEKASPFKQPDCPEDLRGTNYSGL